MCCIEGVHIACEETDSFLTKEDAVKECSLEMLVSAYILEVRPRMPMLSQGEIIGALQTDFLVNTKVRELIARMQSYLRAWREAFPGLLFSLNDSLLDPLLMLLDALLTEDDLHMLLEQH